MKTILIVTGIIAGFLCIFLIETYRSSIKIKKLIRTNWGKIPNKSIYDKIDSVQEYWNKKQEHQPLKYHIDSITWNDLGLNDVFKRINATNSSVGAEYLYAMLHEPCFDLDEMEEFEKLIKDLDGKKLIREKIQFILAKLGKFDNNMVCNFIFTPENKRLYNHRIYIVLALLPIISLLFAIVSLKLAAGMLISTLIINTTVYYRRKYQLEAELATVGYLTSIIVCAGRLANLKDESMKSHFDRIAFLHRKLKRIAGFGSKVLYKPTSEMEIWLEYLKIIFMYDFISYNRIINIILKKNDDFHQLWKEIGRIDAAISIASYRRSLDFYTVPVFTENNELLADKVYHPLIKEPVCNPVQLSKNSIITGSNASGKSTYVKAVAINCIFAQTIHTCLAKSFSLKPSLVITSMAVNDNVIEGDSYFIAELKSLGRILNTINEKIRCLCFIDEILKGTNTIERIAASASILKWVTEKNCLCVVASHDIELTEILKGYDNFHFRENISDKGIDFDYRIYPGWTTTRNAIKLLEYMGYPKDVYGFAQALAEDFEANRKWKSLEL